LVTPSNGSVIYHYGSFGIGRDRSGRNKKIILLYPYVLQGIITGTGDIIVLAAVEQRKPDGKIGTIRSNISHVPNILIPLVRAKPTSTDTSTLGIDTYAISFKV
jgi:hypothetical protein